MKIRRVERADLARISEIVRSTTNFDEEEVETAIELVEDALSGDEGYIVYVLEDDARIVQGYVCYGPTPLTEGTYDLYWIAINKEAQGRGFGQVLLDLVEQEVGKTGGRMLLIETSSKEDYRGTVRFYEKAGYKLVSNIDDFYRPGDGKLTFAKKIQR